MDAVYEFYLFILILHFEDIDGFGTWIWIQPNVKNSIHQSIKIQLLQTAYLSALKLVVSI